MKVPDGIGAIAHTVPSEIPDELFEEAAPPVRSSVRRMPVGKPASIPTMPAVKSTSVPNGRIAKPTSTAKMPAVKPSSVRSTPAAAAAPAATPDVAAMRALSIPEIGDAAPPPVPSSFPSSTRELVVDIATSAPPSSMQGLVTSLGAARDEELLPTIANVEGAQDDALASASEDEDRNGEDDDVLAAGVPKPLVATARFGLVACIIAAVMIVAIGGMAALSSRVSPARPPHAAREVVPELPSAATTPAAPPALDRATPPPAAAPPAPGSAAARDVALGTGIVKTEGATAGRRIFVDEKTVGQTPAAVTVKCGVRKVRIGSAGKAVSVDVPCGGETEVRDR